MKEKVCFLQGRCRIIYGHYELIGYAYALQYLVRYRTWLGGVRYTWITATYISQWNTENWPPENVKTKLFTKRKISIRTRNEKRYQNRYPCERL